ncbi:uncharacterized protein METZ01_LOCUS349037 [marine metagenome]|uniref:Uncharacterized protein n=1 Tax=marine metagenome TaxID=408172 RepID=A0A382RER7_9ZZZZ
MQQLHGMAVQQKFLLVMLQIIQMKMMIVIPITMIVQVFVMVTHILVPGMQMPMVMV